MIAGYGQPLVGRLLTFDAQSTSFGEVKVRRDPNCPACGDKAPVTEVGRAEAPTRAAS